MSPSKQLLQAIAVTAELTGTQLSDAAARVMARDLARYSEPQVLGALTRCRRELRPRGLTIEAVISRLNDGRLGAEEAWASAPKNEVQSVVWTEEMAQAWGIAAPLLAEGDAIAARMAFVETYRKLVQAARDAGTPVRWTPSLGHDPAGRESVLLEAVRKGRLAWEHAARLLPHPQPAPPDIVALLESLD
ncbi:MAG: hypothetical protein IH604_16235 [Burkholderiales bacterium]|nr:hypothetical protein [Burkholderiales bacterium]